VHDVDEGVGCPSASERLQVRMPARTWDH